MAEARIGQGRDSYHDRGRTGTCQYRRLAVTFEKRQRVALHYDTTAARENRLRNNPRKDDGPEPES